MLLTHLIPTGALVESLWQEIATTWDAFFGKWRCGDYNSLKLLDPMVADIAVVDIKECVL